MWLSVTFEWRVWIRAAARRAMDMGSVQQVVSVCVTMATLVTTVNHVILTLHLKHIDWHVTGTCYNSCWEHGTCVNNACVCNSGWGGADCGTCVSGCQTGNSLTPNIQPSTDWFPEYCSSNLTVLTATQGLFSDHNGPAGGDYLPDSHCRWLIKPPNFHGTIQLTFTMFDLNDGAYVTVYDGEDPNKAHIIGIFTGKLSQCWLVTESFDRHQHSASYFIH
jgi:hypothetical protein